VSDVARLLELYDEGHDEGAKKVEELLDRIGGSIAKQTTKLLEKRIVE